MRAFLYRLIYDDWFIILLIIIGLIYKRKKIKSIKLFNIDIIYLALIGFCLHMFTVNFILPIPSYYIKAKDEFIMEEIIEREMIDSGIEFDRRSLRIINSFLGKSNQLYLSRYENDGIEEARMFDFKQNFLGNLKPSRDFNLSAIILREDNEDPDLHNSGYRLIREGIATYFVSYGYGSEPIFKDAEISDFRINSLNPEGYYLTVERINNTNQLFAFIIYSLSLLLIAILAHKAEKKKEFYTVVKIQGKKRDVLVIEYFEKEKYLRP